MDMLRCNNFNRMIASESFATNMKQTWSGRWLAPKSFECISRIRLTDRITQLDDAVMEKVDGALMISLGLVKF
ncbi:hypothetical protein LSPH24S_03035 [Lysinibacillus sphaericus]